jgi:hypothetical protein
MNLRTIGLLLLFLAVPLGAAARGRSHSTRHHVATSHSTYHSHSHRIHRSAAAKRDFMRETGYPHGRKGYVVDHIVPLACGGADVPSNMQWQTAAEGKAKDKWERNGCNK